MKAPYSGLSANILRGMAMNVGQLACFDQATEIIGPFFGDDKHELPSLRTRLTASCVAGFTGNDSVLAVRHDEEPSARYR